MSAILQKDQLVLPLVGLRCSYMPLTISMSSHALSTFSVRTLKSDFSSIHLGRNYSWQNLFPG